MRLALAALAVAVPGALAPAARAGTLGAVVENDSVTPTDRDYTSGVKLFWRSEDGRGARLARTLLFAGDGATTGWGLAVGQRILTPATLTTLAPPPGERSYAGSLYAEFSVRARRRSGATDILAVEGGVVGPSALGEQAQNTLHTLLDIGEARGWDSQLRDEPAFGVSFDRLWRIGTDGAGLGVDATPFLGATAGTVRTEARAGLALRVGWNLGTGPGPVRRAAYAQDYAFEAAPGVVSFALFGGVTGRAVAHDIFLDGGTFRDGLSVDRKTLGGDVTAGAALRLGALQMTASYVRRAEEYETEGGPHKFGSLTLSGGF